MSFSRLAAVITALSISSIAIADDDVPLPFQNRDWHVVPSVLVGVEHFHYSEGDMQPAVVLDQNTGTVPTTQLAVEVTSPLSRFYVRGSFGLTSGSMQYDGANVNGDTLTGPTSGYLTDFEGVVGGRGRIGQHLWLGGYLGFGRHSWERDLRPLGPGGYLEQYAWNRMPIGAVLDVAVTRRLTFSLDAALLYSAAVLGSNLHITDYPIDNTTADPANVPLATDFGERLRISGSYAITRELRVIAMASVEAFQIDDGPTAALTINGQPATDTAGDPLYLSEPFSKTTIYTFDVGASYTF
jgi:hypothetical protein